MPSSWLDLAWPSGGVDRSLSYQQQSPHTTPDALNVRLDDQRSFRQRGGSRPGLGIAIRTELPGEIRLLTKVSVIKADWPKNYAPLSGYQLRDSTTDPPWGLPPSYVPATSNQGLAGGVAGGPFGVGIPVIDYRNVNLPYEVAVHVRPTDAEYDGEVRISVGLPTADGDPEDDSIRVRLLLSDGEHQIIVEEIVGGVITPTASAVFTDNVNAPGVFSVEVNPGAMTVKPYFRTRGFAVVSVGSLGNHYVAVDSTSDTITATKISTEFNRDTSLPTVFDDLRRDILIAVANGAIWMEDTADSLRLVDTGLELNDNVDLVAVDREQKLFIADYGIAINGTGGSIAGTAYNELSVTGYNFTALGIDTDYVFQFINSDYAQNEIQEVELDVADGGTFILKFRGQQTSALAWNASAGTVKTALEALTTIDTVTVALTDTTYKIEFTGTHAGANVETLGYDASALTYSSPGTPTITVTTIQEGAGGDYFLGQYPITGVTANTLTFSPALTVGEGFTATIGEVVFQIVRSAKVYDPKEETLVSHTAVTGTAPAGCRLVCLYRDRIVYAGADLLPHVWYMSRQGDPYDWDYSQEDSAAAVAAQNSIAGQLADPITALIPHSDECLIFGCYNSLWMLRGDPGYGGVIDQLSRKVGIVSAKAWTRTPDDMVVFMSPDGLYVMPAGCAGMPTSLSRERLPDDLLCLNAARESIHLEYDTVQRGIHIFVTKRDESESPHWWFDWETKIYLRVSLQTEHEPFSTHERIAWDDCPIVLVGGRDGKIRYFDRQFQVDDDDNSFTSYCDIGPFALDPETYKDGLLAEISGVLGKGSGAVDWEIRVGDSPEQAYNAATQKAGIWSTQGLNFNTHARARGVAAIVRVSNNTTTRWFLERITAVIRPLGQRRAR